VGVGVPDGSAPGFALGRLLVVAVGLALAVGLRVGLSLPVGLLLGVGVGEGFGGAPTYDRVIVEPASTLPDGVTSETVPFSLPPGLATLRSSTLRPSASSAALASSTGRPR
jgi:hypothetical protein